MQNKVTLLDIAGSDKTIALSAWQSTEIETGLDLSQFEIGDKRIDALFSATQGSKKKSYKDLIKFLLKHGHETPTEKSYIHFQVCADIATHIHCLKHRIGVACITGDTEILLADGSTRRIASIETDEKLKVVSAANPDSCAYSRTAEADVLEAYYNGIRVVCEIETNSGKKIQTTLDHQFLTNQGFMEIGRVLGRDDLFLIVLNGSEFLYTQIKKWTYIGLREVYDLHVKGTHNYIANGFCIHNCNTESARYKELQDKHYIPTEWFDQETLPVSDNNELVQLLVNGSHSWADVLDDYSLIGEKLYHIAADQLSDVLGRKRAKETSRYFLNYNKQLDYDMAFNMRSFAHFCKLRASDHAQREVANIAKEMIKLVKETGRFDVTLEAFGLLDLLDS